MNSVDKYVLYIAISVIAVIFIGLFVSELSGCPDILYSNLMAIFFPFETGVRILG